MNAASYRITIEIDDADGKLGKVQEARSFAGTIGAGATLQWDAQFTPKVEVIEVERVEVEPKQSYEDRRRRLGEEALTQIQHIAYDAGLLADAAEADEAIEGDGADAVRALGSRLRRICDIAEGREPDQAWEPLIEDKNGDIVGGGDRIIGGATSIGSVSEPDGTERSAEAREVYTLEVEGRDDGLYVFSDEGDRNAFATAVESEGSATCRGSRSLHGEASTKALIAAEVEAAFQIDAVVCVRASDADAAYLAAGKLVSLEAEIGGRVHLALLRTITEVGT
jgi:hypothetical protein